ncbi:MAG: DUF4112 domain-containing protein [Planctomycetota bacterium]
MNRQRDLEAQLAEIRRLAKYLDTSFRIPFTGIRFGLDALIGLFPVGGDAATAIAGAYLILKASRANASKGVLLRMVFNLLVDLVVGAIPLVGDFFDFFWRSNHKNAKLLESHLTKQSDSPIVRKGEGA